MSAGTKDITAPVIHCRCCGKPMEAAYQSPLIAGRTGFFYLTCWQEDCRLAGQTFTTKSYDTMDLSAYLEAKR